MNERLAIHALWAGALMYSVAVVSLAALTAARHSYQLPPDTAEAITAKALALFGPILSVVGIVLARRSNGTPVKKDQA